MSHNVIRIWAVTLPPIAGKEHANPKRSALLHLVRPRIEICRYSWMEKDTVAQW